MSEASVMQAAKSAAHAAAPDRIDGRYYQSVPSRSLRQRLLIRARDRIYEDFIRGCQPQRHDTILDVGVSDVVNDAANLVERKYPYPDRITAAGLSSARDFREAFPQVTYTTIEANRPLPFADKTFDVATSNAVIEHVGSRTHQANFVRELARVARRVFITAPNRYFPVEHHTAIPLLHFWGETFRLACLCLEKQEWLDEASLIMMSKADLAALAPAETRGHVGYTGIRLGPFSSNIFLLLENAQR